MTHLELLPMTPSASQVQPATIRSSCDSACRPRNCTGRMMLMTHFSVATMIHTRACGWRSVSQKLLGAPLGNLCDLKKDAK